MITVPLTVFFFFFWRQNVGLLQGRSILMLTISTTGHHIFCIFSSQEVRERSFLLFPNSLIILSVNANACGYKFEVNFVSFLFLFLYPFG